MQRRAVPRTRERSQARRRASASRRRPTLTDSIALQLAAIVVLIAGTIFAARLEERMPALRTPLEAETGANAVILPGTHPPFAPQIEQSGDWITQPLGETTYLSTQSPGSSLSWRFYGTDLSIRARIGPESGVIYVTIDGNPVIGLPTDENGSYVDLFAFQARDASIEIASALAHRDHVITLTHGSEGELAISEILISSRVPFPWVFTLIYTTFGLLLFLTVRDVASRMATHFGWIHGGTTAAPGSTE